MVGIGRKSHDPFVAKMADMAGGSKFISSSESGHHKRIGHQAKKRGKIPIIRFLRRAPRDGAGTWRKTGAHTKGELQPPLQEPAPKQGYFWSFHQDPQRAGRYRTNDGRYTQARK
jgi:hypothetical protein